MIEQMSIARSLTGFNDIGHSVNPTFFPETILGKIVFTLSKIDQKINVGSEQFQDFCPRDIESCHLAVARHVKL